MGRVGRALASHPRTLVALSLSIVAYVALPVRLLPSTRAVMAWDVGSLCLLAMLAALFSRTGDDAAMAGYAEAQDEGAWTIFWITLAGAAASFVAVTVLLANTKELEPWERQWHVAVAASTLLLSWLVTHVMFALRYAHEYYGRDLGGVTVDRGLEFPGTDAPDYWDFLYFAMVLGMTFQVSDVQIMSRKLRRLATAHGLLSFLFNTVIVALTVNIAAGLL